MTWRELITNSHRTMGDALDDSLSSAQLSHGLMLAESALQDMELEDRYKFYLQTFSFSGIPTNGTTITIGATGDIVQNVPTNISAVKYNDGTYYLPVPEIDHKDALSMVWESDSWPERFSYQRASNGLGVITLFPDIGTIDLQITFSVPLTSINVDSNVDLPSGYMGFLQYEIARLLCIDYGQTEKYDLISRESARRLDSIKSNNLRIPPTLRFESPSFGGTGKLSNGEFNSGAYLK